MIAEVYTSIQGEGTRCGTLSTIIRFFDCNLDCSWCDTKDYLSSLKETNSGEITIDCIKDILRRNLNYDIIITGGEPLLHPEGILDIIRAVITTIGRKHPTITIETNGTIIPLPYITSMTPRLLWSVSPKLPSSGNSPNLKVIKHFNNYPGNVQFKFIIDNYSRQDIITLDKVLEHINPKHPIILQPMIRPGRSPEMITYDYMFLIESSLSHHFSDHNIRIIPQLHKIAWGDKTRR